MAISITVCLIFQVKNPSTNVPFLFRPCNFCRTGDEGIFKGTSVTPATTPYFKRDYKETSSLPNSSDAGM